MKWWSEVQTQLVFDLTVENLLNMPASCCGPRVYKLYHHKDLNNIGWIDTDMRLEIGAHAEGARRPSIMMATHY